MWYNVPWWFWAAAVSWAPGQPWDHESKQLTHLHSLCTRTTILFFTFSVYVLSSCSCVQLFEIVWTVAHQAPLSMEFSRHEYWSELPFPSPGDLLDPEFKPTSPTWQVDCLPLSHQESPIWAFARISSLLLLITTDCYHLMMFWFWISLPYNCKTVMNFQDKLETVLWIFKYDLFPC